MGYLDNYISKSLVYLTNVLEISKIYNYTSTI